MARTIETSILIVAPRSRVWSILMDFASYPDWNPFIRSIKGKPIVGERLEAVIQPPGRGASTFRPVVIEAESERSFKWRGSLPVPGLFTGEHRFLLRDEAGGTRFEHSEQFTGLLVPLLGSALENTKRGFEAMNAKMKDRAEARA